jgi:hypothetical protein
MTKLLTGREYHTVSRGSIVVNLDYVCDGKTGGEE